MSAETLLQRLRATDLVSRTGRVRRILSTHLEADGPGVPLGALCEVETLPPAQPTLAEVVGVNPDSIVLAPLLEMGPTFSGAAVVARNDGYSVPVGDAFLGRAVDALGRPIDGGGAIRALARGDLRQAAPSPLDRATPNEVLHTGVRALDGLLTLGKGQRVGVFAASGVGKTSLTTQLANQVSADRMIICLVGERGREVEALWSSGLSAKARARTTLVAATSDQSAALRVRSADFALALADHWRNEGRHVLLLIDSVTRLAMAMREIGLAAGEPPTVRAYTPGVFAAIPRLVERCGALKSGGAVSAIMTVLSETDDVDDPISEMMRSLLDGHIVLSRTLAEQGRFPAIDVPRSLSRLADGLVDEDHRRSARATSSLLSVYDAARTLIESGVYVSGGDADIDRAIARRPAILDFLRQRQDEAAGFEDCRRRLTLLAS